MLPSVRPKDINLLKVKQGLCCDLSNQQIVITPLCIRIYSHNAVIANYPMTQWITTITTDSAHTSLDQQFCLD